MNAKLTKVQRVCRKFKDDLQDIFDTVNGGTEEAAFEISDAYQAATIAQGYAEEAAGADN